MEAILRHIFNDGWNDNGLDEGFVESTTEQPTV